MSVRARPLVSVKHRESTSTEGRDFRTLSESDAPSAVPEREAVPDMRLNYELDPQTVMFVAPTKWSPSVWQSERLGGRTL